jgi:hypothetical protein
MTDEIYFEKNTRLSNSVLWELQKKAYTQFGPEAWFTKNVPFYLTSNPLIARQYAQIVLAFFRDCLAFQTLDPQEPVYILDLGAGTGRFAYVFLKELFEMLSNLKMSLNVCYVMTDIVEANIQFWKSHPYFQSFLEKGCLDFAYYDHGDPKLNLDLLYSGKRLVSGEIKNPLIAIGNYFFDTIPQDIYCVKDHTLYEGRISIGYKHSKETQIPSVTDPAIIPRLIHCVDYVPLSYDLDPSEKEILTGYAKAYENLPCFLFPSGALQVIRHFRSFSKERILFLTGDQGVASDNQLREELPFFSKHGSFSMLVNYHALKEYFKQTGGFCLLTPAVETKMVNMAAISCSGKTEFSEVSEAFRLTLTAFEPFDYFSLVDIAFNEWKDLNLKFMINLVKMGNWDPVNFNLFYLKIREKLFAASSTEKEELARTIHSCWKVFFPVHKQEGAFIMNLGILFFDMKRYEEAILFFQRALNLGYNEPIAFQNLRMAQRIKDLHL